jgi:hypothetical protein
MKHGRLSRLFSAGSRGLNVSCITSGILLFATFGFFMSPWMKRKEEALEGKLESAWLREFQFASGEKPRDAVFGSLVSIVQTARREAEIALRILAKCNLSEEEHAIVSREMRTLLQWMLRASAGLLLNDDKYAQDSLSLEVLLSYLVLFEGERSIPDLIDVVSRTGSSGAIMYCLRELTVFGKKAEAAVPILRTLSDSGPNYHFPRVILDNIRRAAERALQRCS